MATKLQTRILNKISTWSEWQSVKDTFYPLRGEICIVEIPSSISSTGLTPPATGIKVGTWNGVEGDPSKKSFGELPWIQAIAGDVTAWCKENMADFDKFKAQVAAAVADSEGGLQDAIDGLGQRVTALEEIVKTGNDSNTKLRQAITDVNTTVSGHTTELASLSTNKADKSQVATDIKTAKDNILGENSASSDKTVAGAYAAADTAKDAADAASAAAAQALTDANDYTDQEVGKVLGKEGDAATAKTVYGAHAAAAAAQSKADTNAGDIVDIKQDIVDINNLLGGAGEESVSKRLETLEEASEDHAGKIQNNTDAIGAEVTRATKAEEALGTRIAKAEAFLNDANLDADGTNVIDTLKEIQQYITEDESGASAMAASITDTKKKLLGTEDLDTYYGAEGYNIISVKTLAQQGVNDAATAKDAADAAQAAAEAADAKADTNLATAKTYAEGQAAAVLGEDGDAATVKTVYGAHAAAAAASTAAGAAQTAADNAQTAADNAQDDADAANTAIGKLLGSSVSEANGKISTISFANGELTATRKDIVMADMSATEVFIFDCGSATVNAANLTV